MTHDSKEPGTRILQRGDTTTNWATDNPVLMEREVGWDLDLRKVKIGDGVTPWNSLPWAADETASARIAGLSSLALTDGQLVQYDTATGLFIPANPTGDSELAVAENVTGAVTALSTTGGAGTIVAIPFTAISISDSNGRPVTLEYQAQYLAVTNPGVGTAFLLLYETTSGDSLISFTASSLPNSVAAPQAQRAWGVTMKRIGVVSTNRTFELRAYLLTTAGDNANVNILNSSNCSTILRAVAG